MCTVKPNGWFIRPGRPFFRPQKPMRAGLSGRPASGHRAAKRADRRPAAETPCDRSVAVGRMEHDLPFAVLADLVAFWLRTSTQKVTMPAAPGFLVGRTAFDPLDDVDGVADLDRRLQVPGHAQKGDGGALLQIPSRNSSPVAMAKTAGPCRMRVPNGVRLANSSSVWTGIVVAGQAGEQHDVGFGDGAARGQSRIGPPRTRRRTMRIRAQTPPCCAVKWLLRRPSVNSFVIPARPGKARLDASERIHTVKAT
jgi:hypothetical protein